MGQWWNGPAVRLVAGLALAPRAAVRLCTPHLRVKDIRDIDFAALDGAGVEAVVFDKDNCLTAPYQPTIYPILEGTWRECKRIFKGRIVILSNSAGTVDDVDDAEAKAIEERLGVHVVRHVEKKPGGQDSLRALLARIDPKIDHTRAVMIGDRLLTDVTFGNLSGMFTIHTRPLTLRGDNPAAAFFRRVEQACLEGTEPPPHAFDTHMKSFIKV